MSAVSKGVVMAALAAIWLVSVTAVAIWFGTFFLPGIGWGRMDSGFVAIVLWMVALVGVPIVGVTVAVFAGS